ncbi:MAG TPA: RNA polymerase sigma factor [Kofleriaceae bacterium]|nr:RNA polymerase sigma factor [Kofleriaceae bacterium]
MSRRVLPFRRVEGTPAEMSDEALVAVCAMGESAALGALFDRYYSAVRGFLARLAGTDDRDLDDLVQVTFETVPRAARRFDGRSSVKVWLLGVASNVARHHVRTEIRRKRVAEAVAAEPRADALDGAAQVMTRERAARVRDAIADLPVKLREAFVLVYLEGVPGRDVAVLLGVREGTVWKRLHQARARLRESLEGALG